MVATINASVSSSGIVSTADGSGILKVQSNGVTTNALAWVNWDGSTGSGNTIRSSYNVSSITRNATGDFTVSFTNALADANYSVVGTSGDAAGQIVTAPWRSSAAPTTSSFKVGVLLYNATYANPAQISVAVFGN